MANGPTNPTDESDEKKRKEQTIQKTMGQLKDQAGNLVRAAIKTSNEAAGTESMEDNERRAEAMRADADTFKKTPKSVTATPVADTPNVPKTAQASAVPPISPLSIEATSVVPPLKVKFPYESDEENISVTSEPASPMAGSGVTPTTAQTPAVTPIPPVTPTSVVNPTPTTSTPGFFAKLLNAAQVFLTLIGYGIREAYNAAAQNWNKAETPAKTIAEREALAVVEVAKSESSKAEVIFPNINKSAVTPISLSANDASIEAVSAKVDAAAAAQPEKPKRPAWRGVNAITAQMSAEQNQQDQINGLKQEWFILSTKRDFALEGDDGLEAYARKNWGEFSKVPGDINKFNTLKQDIPELISRLEDKDTPASAIPVITKNLKDQMNQYENLHTKLEGYIERQNRELTATKPPV